MITTSKLLLITAFITKILSIEGSITYLHFPANVDPFGGNSREVTKEDAKLASGRLKQLGDNLLENNLVEDAERVLTEALYLGRSSNMKGTEEKDILQSLARIASSRGDLGKEINALNQILNLGREKQILSKYQTADVFFAMGLASMRHHHYEAALKYFYKSIDEFEERDSFSNPFIAENLDFIGEIYLQNNRLEDATNVWLDSMELWIRQGDNYKLAGTMNNLAITYLRLNDYMNAIMMFKGSLMNYDAVEGTSVLQQRQLVESNLQHAIKMEEALSSNTCYYNHLMKNETVY